MANYTVQLTAPVGVYPFNTVRISLTCLGQPQQTKDLVLTPNVAASHVFNIANGTWRLQVSGMGFVPIDEQVVVNNDATNIKNLTVIYYTLHTDRDRDGVLDAAGNINQISPQTVTFGIAGRGAIIPVNCNRDGNNAVVGRTDNQDRDINGNNDLVTGVARLEIRQTIVAPVAGPAAPVPVGWGLKLWLGKARNTDAAARNHFRIFDGDANNSVEIIGPETADEANITTASVGAAKAYGIEAVRFAGRNFASGQGIISLFIIQPEVTGANNPTYMYAERIVAARWIGNHHRQTVSRIYVVDANNANFQAALGVPVANENPPYALTLATPGASALTNVPYLNGNVWQNFIAAGRLARPAVSRDRWMRDTIVSGHSVWPGNGAGVQSKDAFMKTHRWRSLQNWIYQTLISQNVGLYYPAAGSADGINDGNSGGNIAVTPPVQKTVNGATTYYRYGRIYFGNNVQSTVDQSSREFFDAQNMQPPITLDTDWLAVGHVDEMMTFVPDNNPASAFKKWKLLVASPATAYGILRNNRNAHGNAPLLARPPHSPGNATPNFAGLGIGNAIDATGTITDFLGNGQAPTSWQDINTGNLQNYTYKQLRDWNINGVEYLINQNIRRLKAAFDLTDNDIIRVPVIFIPVHQINGNFTMADKISFWTMGADNGFNIYPGRECGFRSGAMTGDMVNMFVGNDKLMIPKPFGPWIVDNTMPNNGHDLFEDDIRQKIAAIQNGPECVFIDDWDDYHVAHGEIHCGTNELRAPYDGQTAFGNARYANWWTAVDA
ncbi:protein-arginine deiminase family protein [Thalassospira povalilytica]|uniref:protein-arginine deiminase family protein n=1 Tax=Thalassospira povalilytica TaxID=732237 RepID=UPI003AA7D0AE